VTRPPVFLAIISPRALLRVLALVFLCFFLGWRLAGGNEPLRTTVPLPGVVTGKTVVIDAGHGGRDPGAVGRSGLAEKEITLDIALRLRRLFSRVGVYVVMTREKDLDYGETGDLSRGTRKSRDLAYRAEIANRSGADLLLSIHVNSFPQSVWSGAQCFYEAGNQEGKELAVAIQDELAARLGPNRRRPVAADYLLLKTARMPAVTVEVGFISNSREERMLADAAYRQQVAEAIFAGTVTYLLRQRERAGSLPVTGREDPVLAGPPPAPPGTARLYFAAPENKGPVLQAEERRLPDGAGSPSDLARRLLAELFAGPGERSLLLPVVPPDGWVRDLRVNGKTAVVDLQAELEPAIQGGTAELLAVYSIVNTLAVNLDLEAVTLLVAGEKGRTLSGHLLLGEPLSPRFDLIRENR
jgi:N-acetylmuramoyl-L-alanine amidase